MAIKRYFTFSKTEALPSDDLMSYLGYSQHIPQPELTGQYLGSGPEVSL